MTAQIIMLLILAIILVAIIFFMPKILRTIETYKNNSSKDIERLSELNLRLTNQLESLRNIVDEKLSKTNESVTQSFKHHAIQAEKNIQEIRRLTEKMTEFSETGKDIKSFAKDLHEIKNIFSNSKQRGIIGEYYLETTLTNTLPPNSYQFQYEFPDGVKVDAIVRVKDKIIPIDSKFSLENYNKLLDSDKNSPEAEIAKKALTADIKKRIDETSKYIKPEYGTMDFAFMFIPHESLYYDLLTSKIGQHKINTQNIIEYAFKKRILIISPTTLLAFLQTVLQALKSLEIEESAKMIIKNVEKLNRHLSKYAEYHIGIGRALTTTVNQYNKAGDEFRKIDKDITKIVDANSKIAIPAEASQGIEEIVRQGADGK